MNEQVAEPMDMSVWYGLVQKALEAPGEPHWATCCTVTGARGAAIDVARDLLRSHPVGDGVLYRVALWANREHTGVVWRISNTGAHRFNPYTGETVDLEPLPISVEPQGNPPAEQTPAQPDGAAAWKESQDATRAGLKWAEAVGKVPWSTIADSVGAQVNPPYVGSFADFLAKNPGFVRDPNSPVAQRISPDVPHHVTETARILGDVIGAAVDYIATHEPESHWGTVEDCLSPIATAASAFVTAYMMWRLGE